ncbi:hypothetical protein ACA910_006121 [Epithemia clementina (nom. ined.)]
MPSSFILGKRFILAFLRSSTVACFFGVSFQSHQTTDARSFLHLSVGADDEPTTVPKSTPHSGRHFLPSHPAFGPSWRRRLFRRRRFMEGWYYRLTLPVEKVSFAIIISIEDPGNTRSDLRLACIQVIGPEDTYLVQADKDDTKFWALKDVQGLGCTFSYKSDAIALDKIGKATTVMSRDDWEKSVKSGFQIMPTTFIGRLEGYDGTENGALEGQAKSMTCEFDFEVEPVCGWGNSKSTAGWLSHFSVFEPHWQVTMADGNATGRFVWQNKTYEFRDAKFYAEKNWGAGLASKWYWTQCNSFEGYEQLSVTAGGGTRGIPFGGKESLGMVCVHYNRQFFEAVPWTGTMSWNVTTWGSWVMQGKATYGDRPFEVLVSYQVDPLKTPGLVFRAPLPGEGMVYFCRDTFEANVTLTVWELEWGGKKIGYVRKQGSPLVDHAFSQQGGAEVGGGPWWSTWTATSELSKPVLALLRIPVWMKSRGRKLLPSGRNQKVNGQHHRQTGS